MNSIITTGGRVLGYGVYLVSLLENSGCAQLWAAVVHIETGLVGVYNGIRWGGIWNLKQW